MRRGDTGMDQVRGRDRGFGARIVRPLRRAAVPCVLAVALAAGGCATKNDLKQLRSEVVQLQARQDSLLRQLQQVMLDSLRTNTELMLRVRGDLGYQLQQMEQQLIQIQELTGQSQRRLADLRQQWESRSQQYVSTPATEPAQAAGGNQDVEQLYALGLQKLQEGAAATARAAFEGIVNRYPTHERAADAQFQIAETYVAEEAYDRALQEFDRVIELFPNSARAPQALYRAGVISEERGNISRAREYFSRVARGYPQSEEARLAGEKLRRLRGR